MDLLSCAGEKPRRLARIDLTWSLLISLCRVDPPSQVWRVTHGIPEDAQIFAVEPHHDQRMVSLIFEHPSFGEVPLEGWPQRVPHAFQLLSGPDVERMLATFARPPVEEIGA